MSPFSCSSFALSCPSLDFDSCCRRPLIEAFLLEGRDGIYSDGNERPITKEKRAAIFVKVAQKFNTIAPPPAGKAPFSSVTLEHKWFGKRGAGGGKGIRDFFEYHNQVRYLRWSAGDRAFAHVKHDSAACRFPAATSTASALEVMAARLRSPVCG